MVVGCYEGHEWPDSVGVCFVGGKRGATSRAVAVPNGSQANRISNLVPLPTSEYHWDINISGGGHPPAALPPHADTGFIFSPSLHPDKEQKVIFLQCSLRSRMFKMSSSFAWQILSDLRSQSRCAYHDEQ